MPYTKKQHGLIGAALGAKKAGKSAPSYVPASMSKLSASKLGEMAASPTRKKIGKGDWGKGELKSAGGSQTVVEASVMLQGDKATPPTITNHKGEPMSEDCCCGKMGKTQKAMSVGA